MTSTNSHMDLPLTVFGTPLKDAHTAVLLLHGRTQTPADMFDMIVRRLDLPGVAYFAPAAAGNTWYPESFISPLEKNQPALDHALSRLQALSDDLAGEGFGPAQQIVMGFSQGACLGCEFVWRQSRAYRALVGFTGALIGPDRQRVPRSRDFGDMPVLLGGRDEDPWVSASCMADTSASFRAAGAQVKLRLYPGKVHEINDDEIGRARSLLQGFTAIAT